MPKLILDPVGNFTSATIAVVNNNSDKIEAALENTLSRNGATPNHMLADLDLNENDILNVGLLDAETISVGGSEDLISLIERAEDAAVESEASAAASAASALAADASADLVETLVEQITPNKVLLLGDGVTTVFDLGQNLSLIGVDVYISGVYQQSDQYSVAGTEITFNEAPPAPTAPGEENIEIRIGAQASIASSIPGPNSVNTIQIVDSAVTNAKIADGTIGSEKFADAGTIGLEIFEAETVLDVNTILGLTEDVTVLSYGAQALADGSGTGVDQVPFFQAGIDDIAANGGGVLRVPFSGTGIYLFSSALEMKSNVTVRVDQTVKFDCNGSTSAGLKYTGTAGVEQGPLFTDYTRGGTALSTSPASHGLVVGDLIQIIGQRNCLSSESGDWRCGDGTVSLNFAYFGEWLEVAEVTSVTNIRTASPLIFPNYRNDITQEIDTERSYTTIRKMTPVRNAHWFGGEFLAETGSTLVIGLFSVDCTFNEAVIRRGNKTGDSVRWDKSLRCFANDVKHYNDPTLVWSYTTLHGQMNRYKTISTQDCGFRRCYDEFGAQSFDLTYGGTTTPYLVNIRSIVQDCETYRCFEAATSHPGCFQDLWVGNRFLECYRGGILVRGLQPVIAENFLTSSTELVPILSDGSGSPSAGITIQDGHAKGTHAYSNKIFGFRFAFRIVDGGDSESRFTEVDALIENNDISDCYAGLGTTFSIAGAANNYRRVSYIGNSHRRMQRYVIELSEYAAGFNVRTNSLNGHFLNEAGDTSAAFLAAPSGNAPALTFMGNNWFRDAGTNGGITLRVINVGNITDTIAFPSGSYAGKSRVRDNSVNLDFGTMYTFVNTAYTQTDATPT